ncbi:MULTISPECIES: ornithine carbamoyltransferase [Pontibacillus]|uniref:Ornithine carbamoyltransferase n=1 Tax=Pontibacillus chungwhensis TaxID=265426 RepID=A0ABY8UYU0_9BACI|nr:MULTISPECIES: ornithine carbamoyltransferase [Pontibacillus]MCD5323443.1 ornithine carbamoyltransferase [Pontibacillus sp. HN14]WIF96821.1 ornithine carbamoyltransferase [Pontibacillus chungwhensis]
MHLKDHLSQTKDFLTIGEWTFEKIQSVLEQAHYLKDLQQKEIPHPYLKGKVLGMLFEKASTRTRVSFEAGMFQLGGSALYLNSNDLQLGRGETIEDTAKVLSRYVDAIMIRTFSHDMIEQFAESATVPVINGLTDLHHPTQVMADLMTIEEIKGELPSVKVAYVGDGNNMAHSLIEAASTVGMELCVATPPGYEPKEDVMNALSNDYVSVTHDPFLAVKDADVIMTDVWASMGQENLQLEREGVFTSYQVNESLCAVAKEDYIFMHCLPAHRGEEVTSDIIDGSHSVVYDQAENRLHVHKAILQYLLKVNDSKEQ